MDTVSWNAHKLDFTVFLCHYEGLFSFIIMPRNSQVRGLCNPVVDSSLLNSTLNYHVQCFLT